MPEFEFTFAGAIITLPAPSNLYDKSSLASLGI